MVVRPAQAVGAPNVVPAAVPAAVPARALPPAVQVNARNNADGLGLGFDGLDLELYMDQEQGDGRHQAHGVGDLGVDTYLPIPTIFFSANRNVNHVILADARGQLSRAQLAKPWILIFFPTDEGNQNAFPHSQDDLIRVMAVNYNVIYSRVSGTREMISYIKMIKALYPENGRGMRLAHDSGTHGASDHMSFSHGGKIFKVTHPLSGRPDPRDQAENLTREFLIPSIL